MRKRIAITGLGALAPHGHSIEAICASRAAGNEQFRLVEGLDSTRFVSERLKRKLDPFTVYGLCAAGMALDDSGLLTSGLAPERIGIFVGNCLGGWGFTAPELQRLHRDGVDAMGPYVATAWFPAAVQGQISLAYGITGYSKTFSSSDVAGLGALGHAMRTIESGRTDAALCGAAESLASPYVRTVVARHAEAAGLAGPGFAEGAAFLVLEDHDRAVARGAPVHAVLSGYAERFGPADRTLASSDADALVLRCGPAGESDSRFGRMFAVSGVIEAACAAWHLGRGGLRAADLSAAAGGSDQFAHAVIHLRSRAGGEAVLGISAAGTAADHARQEEYHHVG